MELDTNDWSVELCYLISVLTLPAPLTAPALLPHYISSHSTCLEQGARLD